MTVRKTHRHLLALLSLVTCNALAAAPDCADTAAALEYWQPIREAAADTTPDADTHALELVNCLASPDPELRDRIGYELLTYWLREDQLTDDTRFELLRMLTPQLRDVTPTAGLRRSFSALILAELMRSDGIKPFMSTIEREHLLSETIAALDAETDFRGLEEAVGWVHPVAHMADLLWRFALHPATSTEQGTTLLGAVRSKVAPTTTAYRFNEGDRLARVISTLIRRGLVDYDIVAAWIGEFARPVSMESWSHAFQSPAGMAELHNTKQFLRALSDQLEGEDVDDRIAEPLKQLVGGFTDLI